MQRIPDILSMPPKTFAFYCLVFAAGVVESVYIIWWRDNWFDAFLAASAMGLVLIPIFVRHEFAVVGDLDKEHRVDLKAQRIAGDARIQTVLQIERGHDEENLMRLRLDDAQRIAMVHEQNTRLVFENEKLREKYLPFSPEMRRRGEHGRFISTKARITHETLAYPVITTIEGTHE